MSLPRKPLMAGNWKMNLNHLEAIALVQKLAFSLRPQDFDAVDVVVLPPFTDTRSVQTLIDGDKLRIQYGAQDVSALDSGARTGDVSGPMLAKLGCTHVVVGHSERREFHLEDDDIVRSKTAAALRNGLTPIVCVGEPIEVRQQGLQVEHCVSQLDGALEGLSAEQAATVIVAYEPIWAIGTGQVATPEDAQEVAGALRSAVEQAFGETAALAVRILYGGSVKASSAQSIMAQPDVDGALVGGASLDAEEFARVVRYRDEIML